MLAQVSKTKERRYRKMQIKWTKKDVTLTIVISAAFFLAVGAVAMKLVM